MNKKLLAMILLPILALACSLSAGSRSVEGSGVKATETRTLKTFTSIEVQGSADVTVSFGEVQSVVVETDDNLMALIETKVQGDKLIIGEPVGTDINTRLGIQVTIVMKSLDTVTISGSGNVTIDGLVSDLVRFEVPGSGNITAQGTANTVNATINGSGNILCGDLQAKTADAQISGSGNITVYVTESLYASIAGSGTVEYRGNPAKVDQSVSGSGSVTAKP
ncbi:MAG: DUF2807 domain-containing protein [Anaerolineales bacterium]|nr:DUF2807 domain-containing protein [Anaerolineales bacterium]